MNTATRVLPNTKVQLEQPINTLMTKPSMGTLLLALIVMFSGLLVIYIADLNRRAFIELQEVHAVQNQLRIESTKLLLEQSTWARQARVQDIAQQNLGMVVPTSERIIMLKLDS